MSNIHAIIATLSNESKKEFVRNLRERNKRNDTKNVELFRLLDNANMPSDIDVILYGKPSKGAYHALSKRLHDLLIDFIATKGFDKESSEEMNALKLLLASRIFFQQKQFYIAFKTLSKAELIADKHSLFNILNEIYQTLLLHAHLNATLDLQKVIDKYQANRLNIGLEENLNLFYATIQKELNDSNPGISDIINRNLVKFNISITKNLSYQSLFKILQITNQVAYVTRDYQAILPFIEDACKKIEATERTKDKHLYDHLQVLYYLANTYFRIKNFELSASYLDTMHSNMSLENKKYGSVF
jgi:tetratricopeptide (TPR) repeat protein